jgi:hypothetical protein
MSHCTALEERLGAGRAWREKMREERQKER